MKDYQLKSIKSCRLPETVYRQALWAVKDLPRMKEKLMEMEESLDCLPSAYSGTPGRRGGSTVIGDQTARTASQMASLAMRIQQIEKSLDAVPEAYRDGILGKLAYGVPYSDQFHMNTWKRWQQVFLYQVAVNLQLY